MSYFFRTEHVNVLLRTASKASERLKCDNKSQPVLNVALVLKTGSTFPVVFPKAKRTTH